MAGITTISPRRQRIFEIIEIGALGDRISRGYDIVNMLSIIVNLVVSIMYTFEGLRAEYGTLLLSIEAITVALFAADYCLRIYTAKCRFPKKSEAKAL